MSTNMVKQVWNIIILKVAKKKIFRYQFLNTIDMFKNPFSENKLKTYRIVVCSSSEFHWTLDREKCLTEFECIRWTVWVRTDRLDPVDTDPGVFGRQAERGPGRAHCVRLPFLLSLLLRWYVPEGVIVLRLFWVIIYNYYITVTFSICKHLCNKFFHSFSF